VSLRRWVWLNVLDHIGHSLLYLYNSSRLEAKLYSICGGLRPVFLMGQAIGEECSERGMWMIKN
jgi:hypothetical protein